MKIIKSYIDGPFGQLHLRSAGSGGRPLICLHMSPYSGDFFTNFMAEMATDRLVICPDTPGYGGSDKPHHKPSVADYAAAIGDMVTALDIDSFDVLGFHTGTFIAVELALLMQNNVHALVLPGIPLFDMEKRQDLAAMYVKGRPYFSEEDYILKRWQLGLKGRGGMTDDRFLAQFAESLKAGSGDANWGFEAVFAYEPEMRLPLVTQPVFIPVPDEALADNSRSVAPLFQNATVAEWPTMKGDLFEINAEEVASNIRTFLEA